ncbi:hypothetical protein MalM25_28220 [Planctomycetes bacterium MalM25]|nr:hypothetical protein MalM25_28220 [Planctomycetes bacterium MalM25]
MSLANSSTNLHPGDDAFAVPEVRAQIHRMSIDTYHRLGEQGMIDERTELIRGVVIDKMSKSPLHVWIATQLADLLRDVVGPNFYLRAEQPLTLCDSEPEPDIAIVPGSPNDYRARHPIQANLVVEVALSSEKLDREKAYLYAEAGFPEYWLILPNTRTVELHQDPKAGVYKTVVSLGADQTLTTQAAPELTLRVADLFPPDA